MGSGRRRVLRALGALCCVCLLSGAGRRPTSAATRRRVVHVAAPTGDRATDRSNILAAFTRARPGDTVQFVEGAYVVGEIIPVSTPGLTILGDAHGTVLRGCSPAAYEKLRREEADVIRAAIKSHRTSRMPAGEAALMRRCGMFQLTGGHDTVRNLTFEYMRLGLMLGDEYQQGHWRAAGGYLVEGNTFRNTDNSIRVGVSSPDPTVIRSNTFVDTYHAVSAGGSNIHVLRNTVLAPAPDRVPANQYPSDAIGITAIAPRKGTPRPTHGRCDHNVVAGNLIDGYPDGVTLTALPGTACRNNVVRDNTIAVRSVSIPHSSVDWGLFPDSTFVGVPISLAALAVDGRTGIAEDNRIEGNRVLGAEGYGIKLGHASRNRVAGNTIVGILRRSPPGGDTASPSKPATADGAGIWVSSGSDGNEIADNTFEDIATYAVVLEGDDNTVRTRRAKDTVRDLGRGNHVKR